MKRTNQQETVKPADSDIAIIIGAPALRLKRHWSIETESWRERG
jgi:hypothetical protein